MPPLDRAAERRPRKKIFTPFTVGIVAAFAGILVAYISISRQLERVSHPQVPPSLDSIRSLAVLPINNISDDSADEYLAEGMTDSIIAELAKIKDSYNCDGLSIAAATAAMGCKDWLAGNQAKMNATRQRMSQRLAEIGFDVTPSQANFVWCQHPSGRHEAMYEFLKKNQILVRYMKFPDWGDGLRISVGTDEQIDACLMILERFMV